MLTGAAVTRVAPVSLRSTARAWRPAARALPWLTIAAILAMAIAPSLVVLLQGGDDFAGAVTAALLFGGGTAGYFVEDDAGETLSASPTCLGRRRLLRLTALALASASTFLAIVLMAVERGPIAELVLDDRAVELLAVAGLAAGAAGLLQRSGGASPGPTGAVTGPLAALVISALAVRWSALPTLVSPMHHDRWWLVALAGWAAAAWTSRD